MRAECSCSTIYNTFFNWILRIFLFHNCMQIKWMWCIFDGLYLLVCPDQIWIICRTSYFRFWPNNNQVTRKRVYFECATDGEWINNSTLARTIEEYEEYSVCSLCISRWGAQNQSQSLRFWRIWPKYHCFFSQRYYTPR